MEGKQRENRKKRKDGQERRQRGRPVETGLLQRQCECSMKSHTNNEPLMLEVFGLGKLRRSKAARAEMGSESLLDQFTIRTPGGRQR
jgi:hypothetical protein